jgi:xanthine dehydrogenase accessory factor
VRRELIDLAARLSREGQPFALATVVARSPPISAQVGDTALVTSDGGFHGWVGGSCTRPTVLAEARKVLLDGRARLIAIDPDPASRQRPGLTVFPMTCHSGGSVEIHIQPVLPPARLLIYGVSPTARALVRLGRAMGYAVTVIDAGAEAADFPEADAVLTDPAAVARAVFATAAPRYAVVATQGQWDEEAIAAALALDPPPAYLGVMASGKRFGEMRALLAERAGEAALQRIKNPAGLDLGGTSPEEIAVSILAEIVAGRAGVAASTGATTSATRSTSTSTSTATSTAMSTSTGVPGGEKKRLSLAQQAIDPVCGMTVDVAGAKHRAEHEGRSYYFCCGGCRARFLASPGSFLAQEATR